LLRLSPLLQIDNNLSQDVSAECFHERFPHYKELLVRAGTNWKAEVDVDTENHPPYGHAHYDPRSILESTQDDLVALWGDAAIRHLLRCRHIKLEGMSGL
jgi:hypothetical protein